MMDGSSREGGELDELKELFDRKTAEVESLSAVVLEKEELIYTLQDRIQDTEEQVDELTQQLAAAEIFWDRLEASGTQNPPIWPLGPPSTLKIFSFEALYSHF